MKDRFKFRFWHKPTQKMLNCYGFNEHYTFADTLDGIGTEYNPCKTNDCVLMQCTGLKDKKSQLIYEGDIVKTKFVGRDIPEHKVNVADYDFFIVIFEKALFRLEKTNPDRWFSCFYIAGREQQFEVIGNIYENPELLEVNNASRNGLMRIK